MDTQRLIISFGKVPSDVKRALSSNFHVGKNRRWVTDKELVFLAINAPSLYNRALEYRLPGINKEYIPQSLQEMVKFMHTPGDDIDDTLDYLIDIVMFFDGRVAHKLWVSKLLGEYDNNGGFTDRQEDLADYDIRDIPSIPFPTGAVATLTSTVGIWIGWKILKKTVKGPMRDVGKTWAEAANRLRGKYGQVAPYCPGPTESHIADYLNTPTEQARLKRVDEAYNEYKVARENYLKVHDADNKKFYKAKAERYIEVREGVNAERAADIKALEKILKSGKATPEVVRELSAEKWVHNNVRNQAYNNSSSIELEDANSMFAEYVQGPSFKKEGFEKDGSELWYDQSALELGDPPAYPETSLTAEICIEAQKRGVSVMSRAWSVFKTGVSWTMTAITVGMIVISVIQIAGYLADQNLIDYMNHKIYIFQFMYTGINSLAPRRPDKQDFIMHSCKPLIDVTSDLLTFHAEFGYPRKAYLPDSTSGFTEVTTNWMAEIFWTSYAKDILRRMADFTKKYTEEIEKLKVDIWVPNEKGEPIVVKNTLNRTGWPLLLQEQDNEHVSFVRELVKMVNTNPTILNTVFGLDYAPSPVRVNNDFRGFDKKNVTTDFYVKPIDIVAAPNNVLSIATARKLVADMKQDLSVHRYMVDSEQPENCPLPYFSKADTSSIWKYLDNVYDYYEKCAKMNGSRIAELKAKWNSVYGVVDSTLILH